MSKSLKRRLALAKKMLKILNNKTMHRTDWLILCAIGTTRFNSMLKFLLEQGYIKRPKKGVYQITEKGKLFAESIS